MAEVATGEDRTIGKTFSPFDQGMRGGKDLCLLETVLGLLQTFEIGPADVHPIGPEPMKMKFLVKLTENPNLNVPVIQHGDDFFAQ